MERTDPDCWSIEAGGEARVENLMMFVVDEAVRVAGV